MSLPTPNYVLMSDVRTVLPRYPQKDVILPVGAFARPIEDTYLPTHIKETMAYKHRNEKLEVFCYTHYGIVSVPWNKLRRV